MVNKINSRSDLKFFLKEDIKHMGGGKFFYTLSMDLG